jgi:DNA-binding MarR family transcriptional regulator
LSNEQPLSKAFDMKATELHGYTAFWLHRLSAEVLGRFESKLKDYDVTHAQWLILNVLYCETANVPLVIAKVIGIDAAAISRGADRLIEKGLVDKRANPGDNRSVTLALTKLGYAVMNETIAIADEQEKAWQACLSKSERLQFSETLNKLLKFLESDRRFVSPDPDAGSTTMKPRLTNATTSPKAKNMNTKPSRNK